MVIFSLFGWISFASAQKLANSHNDSKLANGAQLSQPMTIGWRYDSNLTINLTPASDEARVYLPLAGGIIVSLKAPNGQLNWRSEVGGELSASPVADDRAVYVASETGKPESGVRRATGALRALGREGGVTQWMRTLAMPLRGSLTLANGRLFAGGSDGKIYAFDSRNGELSWSYDYGQSYRGLSRPRLHWQRRWESSGSRRGYGKTPLALPDEGPGARASG
jgi:outer membrane protein assembly factor BamB